ncbi:type II toxin-antitoxin system RelE/ParE family toxin [Rhodopila sp.]|uniref:type II toxin-antitoxin system RelE/ParE family toxin n=1 Tax=Rhodopila sp. TaxID=2480087 RepID=UPI003D11A654
MTPATLSPMANRDLEAATRWIAKDNPAAARALRSIVARTAITIGEHPNVGSQRPDIVPPPFRIIPLRGFPYIIVYHSDRRPPVIARLLHGARDLPEILRDL